MTTEDVSVIVPDPTALRTEDVLDSLLYEVSCQPSRCRVVLIIEVDPDFHSSLLAKLGIVVVDQHELLIELIAEQVTRLEMHGVNSRPQEWAADEKPHNSEITNFVVRRRSWLSKHFEMTIGLATGPRLLMEFSSLRVAKSIQPPGVIHNYPS